MTKVRNMTEITEPVTTDLVYVVHDPSGTPEPKKTTITNLLSGLSNILNLGTVNADFTATTNTTSMFDLDGTVEITLPSSLLTDFSNTIVLDFSTTSGTQPTLSSSGNILWENILNGLLPTWDTTSGNRNVIILNTNDNGSNWSAQYYIY